MSNISEPTSWPKIVTQEQWNEVQAKQLKLEKGLTRMRDAVAASRKRLPMVEITTP